MLLTTTFNVLCQVNGQIDKALIFTIVFPTLYKLQFGSGNKYSEQLHLIILLVFVSVLTHDEKQDRKQQILSGPSLQGFPHDENALKRTRPVI